MKFLIVVFFMSSMSALAMDIEGESAEKLLRLTQRTFNLDCSGRNCDFEIQGLECLGVATQGTTCTATNAADLNGPLMFGYDPSASAFANSLEELYFSGKCGTLGSFDICLASSLSCQKTDGVATCSVIE